MKLSISKNMTDVLACLVLGGLDLFAFVESRDYPARSQFFVNIILVMMTALLVVYAIITAYKIIQDRKEGVVVAEEDKILFLNSKLLGGTIAFIVYIFLLIPNLGFYCSTAIFCFCLAYYLGTRNIKVLLPYCIGFPAVLYLGFQIGLNYYMPKGILF